MKGYILFSLLAITFWGLWGFLSKIATRSLSPYTVFILSYVGGVVVFPIYLVIFSKNISFDLKNIDTLWGITSGMVAGVGSLSFYIAASKGESSIVVPLTALYPLITVILSFLLLHEGVSVKKVVGIILALISVVFLAQS